MCDVVAPNAERNPQKNNLVEGLHLWQSDVKRYLIKKGFDDRFVGQSDVKRYL